MGAINKDLICSFDLESFGLYPDWSLLLCGSIKPWGKPVETYRLDDLPGETPGDDSRLVAALVERLSKFMVLIAHYGRMHDRVYLNSKAARYRLPLLPPRGRIIDPYQVAKRHLKLSSNSLEALSGFLGIKTKKLPMDNSQWFRAAFDRSREGMDYVVRRCVLDVVILEEMTEPLIPFLGDINMWGSA